MASSTDPFYLVGPTASGKSDISVGLARAWEGEVINADAYQIYDALPTLTARPMEEDMADVPHHLFGTLPATEPCDAFRLSELAKEAITEVQERGKKPIVVGGSGLYMKALTHGLAPPPSDPKIREELLAKTPEERLAQLIEVDPVGAESTDQKNDRYVTRNLEICLISGLPLAETKASWQGEVEPFTGALLDWPREVLYTRINARTKHMFTAGVIDEVKAADTATFSDTAKKMIGLRQILEHIEGTRSHEDTIGAMQQGTRRFAKRQLTWFRKEKEYTRINLLQTDSLPQTIDKVLAAS